VFLFQVLLTSCIYGKEKSPSFQELIKMDSLSNGSIGSRINNYIKLSEQFYFEVISDKDELYKIISKMAESSPEKDFLLSNFQSFSFEKTDKKKLSIYYKGNLLTVIEGFDYCYKPYLNGDVWNKILLFDKHDRCIINGDKLKKSFREQLFNIYKANNVIPLEIKDGNSTYRHHIILKYTCTEGLHSFCDNNQYDKSLTVYKSIDEFCSSFCKKNNLKKIIFDCYVF
jgi:hypothetical protein